MIMWLVTYIVSGVLRVHTITGEHCTTSALIIKSLNQIFYLISCGKYLTDHVTCHKENTSLETKRQTSEFHAYFDHLI